MKAFVVHHYGKDGVRATDVPMPDAGRSDLLVKVSAASINPLDLMVRNGAFKQLLKYRPPFVLGHDVAGVVTEIGSGVSGFAVGDEVFARPRDLRIGTFAEYIAIDGDDAAPKPATLSLHEAAAVPLVALAAWQILVEVAHIAPGQKVPNGESSLWGDYHLRELAVLIRREANGDPYPTFFGCCP